MIDEYWTFVFYGYHSDDLSHGSGKPIVVRCDGCCQYRVSENKSYRELCPSCSRSGERNYWYGKTGDKNPMYGRTGNKNPNWGGGKHIVECHTCGKIIELYQSKKELYDRHFCRSECKSSFMSAHLNDFYSDQINLEKLSAAMQGISYDEWEGFATDKPYCPAFDETCRESNREKYGRQCFLCGLLESENTTSVGKHIKLAVHHVDMNKEQGCDDHEWKLVPLCLHHHGGAHSDLVMNRIIYLLEHVWSKV